MVEPLVFCLLVLLGCTLGTGFVADQRRRLMEISTDAPANAVTGNRPSEDVGDDPPLVCYLPFAPC